MTNPKSILVTGASGLIGTRLTEFLLQKGHQISHLGRVKKNGIRPSFTWDVTKRSFDKDALKEVDTIINLAGVGIADKRWTRERKKEVLESRTESVKLIYQTLGKVNHNVKTFISASAVGYYGVEDHEKLFVETDKPGTDFLAAVTRQWEAEVDKLSTLGIRIVKFRIGIVLSPKGGALKEIARPVKMFVGAPLGTGQQYLSWIHIDDLCNMFIQAVEDSGMVGAYNAVAPSPVTNEKLTREIAKVLRRRMIIPKVPSFILRILLGEMADMVLKGNKVSSKKIEETGFTYRFRNLRDALDDLLSAPR
jgi:uncharacterized protein